MADGTARCGRYTVNVENQRGSIPLSVASFLLGYSLVWPKALVFEISIIGSNPITPASLWDRRHDESLVI